MELGHFVEHLVDTHPSWLLLLSLIGFLSFLKFSILLLNWVFVFFLRPGKDLTKYGSWAVVTGSTDGIGRAFAFRLACAGLNLVIVGRSPAKLQEVSSSILAKNPKTQIKTVVIDFSADLVAGVEDLKREIAALDVGVLINCAGVSYPYARFLHEVDEELMRNVIRVNVEGTTRVTHAVISGMVERKRGAIVNIGSGAATIIPCDPLYSIYAASKAYIDQFSRCLHVEYKNKGIDVQCQVPLYVATKMASIRKSSFFVPSADTYARVALNHIGYEATCTPYWPHSAIWCLLSLLPESAIDNWRLGFCLNIRKKGQLKDAKKKDQ